MVSIIERKTKKIEFQDKARSIAVVGSALAFASIFAGAVAALAFAQPIVGAAMVICAVALLITSLVLVTEKGREMCDNISNKCFDTITEHVKSERNIG